MDERRRPPPAIPPLAAATAKALADGVAAHTIVLVEGRSDQRALETLAARRHRDLDGVAIVAMGGSKAVRGFLELYGPDGYDLRLAGLCDAGEEGDLRRGLRRAGLGADLSRAAMERLGFFVCDADLEDELIRCLGPTAVEAVIEAQGELRAFRTLRKQPAQQGRSLDAQLRRFMGSKSGRKVDYAALLVEALDLTRVPAPLDGVLDYVSGPARRPPV